MKDPTSLPDITRYGYCFDHRARCDSSKLDPFYYDVNMPETEEGVAPPLSLLVVLAERLAKSDRQELLDIFAECLAAVRMEYWH